MCHDRRSTPLCSARTPATASSARSMSPNQPTSAAGLLAEDPAGLGLIHDPSSPGDGRERPHLDRNPDGPGADALPTLDRRGESLRVVVQPAGGPGQAGCGPVVFLGGGGRGGQEILGVGQTGDDGKLGSGGSCVGSSCPAS